MSGLIPPEMYDEPYGYGVEEFREFDRLRDYIFNHDLIDGILMEYDHKIDADEMLSKIVITINDAPVSAWFDEEALRELYDDLEYNDVEITKGYLEQWFRKGFGHDNYTN